MNENAQAPRRGKHAAAGPAVRPSGSGRIPQHTQTAAPQQRPQVAPQRPQAAPQRPQAQPRPRYQARPQTPPRPVQTSKSGRPLEPGNREMQPHPNHRAYRRTFIVHRPGAFCKRLTLPKFLLLAAGVTVIAAIIVAFALPTQSSRAKPTVVTYVFKDGKGQPVNLETLTNLWAAKAGDHKRYNLNDSERWEIASVVTAEADGEPFVGKLAVAQCILQACEDDGLRPRDALKKYEYSELRPNPSEEALDAVAAVFDLGITATDEPIKYFYSPGIVRSDWHESQGYALTINNHRFFKEAQAE